MTLNTITATVTESVHSPHTPVLHITGVDVHEMGDAWTLSEVEILIQRLNELRDQMIARKSVLDLECTPTLWDIVN
jgi:hypothetical protein